MRRNRVHDGNGDSWMSVRSEGMPAHSISQASEQGRTESNGGDAILGAISPENLFAIGAKKQPASGRMWESYYSPEVQGEPHPQNRFVEGRTAEGETIASSADYYARAFVPDESDILASMDVKASQVEYTYFQTDRDERAASRSETKSTFVLAILCVVLAFAAVLIRYLSFST